MTIDNVYVRWIGSNLSRMQDREQILSSEKGNSRTCQSSLTQYSKIEISKTKKPGSMKALVTALPGTVGAPHPFRLSKHIIPHHLQAIRI